jgi:hypothetical protein
MRVGAHADDRVDKLILVPPCGPSKRRPEDDECRE